MLGVVFYEKIRYNIHKSIPRLIAGNCSIKTGEKERQMLPEDPVILLSFVNLKLRDFYDSLDALCEDLGADGQALTEKLAAIGYHYDAERNQFV